MTATVIRFVSSYNRPSLSILSPLSTGERWEGRSEMSAGCVGACTYLWEAHLLFITPVPAFGKGRTEKMNNNGQKARRENAENKCKEKRTNERFIELGRLPMSNREVGGGGLRGPFLCINNLSIKTFQQIKTTKKKNRNKEDSFCCWCF